MSEQAQALYDFDGQEDSEISIRAGEVLTITNKDVGEGWWEGMTPDGRKGLFPQSYVEICASGASPAYGGQSSNYDQPPQESYDQSDQGNAQYTNDNYPNDDESTWSEDWEDNTSSQASYQAPPAETPSSTIPPSFDIPQSGKGKSARVGGSVGKQLNRFSSFVKAGGEHFMLGKADATVRKNDQIMVTTDASERYMWEPIQQRYDCTIENPTQQSKMKGLKKFVCYNLTPSDTQVTVERRYKHFDWLYQRLSEKFTMVALPKLPDKQAAGRFEEDFIEARMARLKLWIGYMCNHPVISQSKLFRNFISLTEQKAWKMSKRQAEKDDIVGANFFKSITMPASVPLSSNAEQELENFRKFTKGMDDGLNHLTVSSHNLVRKFQSVYKKDFQDQGKALTSLSAAFGMPEAGTDPSLTEAISHAGDTYVKIGDSFCSQTKLDILPLIDTVWLHKGVLDSMPDLFHIQTGALRKVKECRKLVEENKMTSSDCGGVAERCDTIVACMQSEITHFHQERSHDFALAMRDYLQGQVEFYSQVTEQLREAQSKFDAYLSGPQYN